MVAITGGGALCTLAEDRLLCAGNAPGVSAGCLKALSENRTSGNSTPTPTFVTD